MWTPPPSQSNSRAPSNGFQPPSQQPSQQQSQQPSQQSSQQPSQQPPHQPYSQPYQQISPPTSLLSHSHIPAPCRQLHPPKSPLYRPAVLRAIERPIRPATANSTPTGSPKSMNEEFADDKSSVFENDDTASESAIDFSVCEDEIAHVTGPPRRDHWKPDGQVTACDSPTCIRTFGMMIRRHHCRRCGNVYCFQHATKWLPLSQNARFHPKGHLSKVCDGCYNDYQRLLQLKRNNSMSSTSTSSTLSNAPPMRARDVKPITGARPEDELTGKFGSLVLGSVPRDWNWSTF